MVMIALPPYMGITPTPSPHTMLEMKNKRQHYDCRCCFFLWQLHYNLSTLCRGVRGYNRCTSCICSILLGCFIRLLPRLSEFCKIVKSTNHLLNIENIMYMTLYLYVRSPLPPEKRYVIRRDLNSISRRDLCHNGSNVLLIHIWYCLWYIDYIPWISVTGYVCKLQTNYLSAVECSLLFTWKHVVSARFI